MSGSFLVTDDEGRLTALYVRREQAEASANFWSRIMGKAAYVNEIEQRSRHDEGRQTLKYFLPNDQGD